MKENQPTSLYWQGHALLIVVSNIDTKSKAGFLDRDSKAGCHKYVCMLEYFKNGLRFLTLKVVEESTFKFNSVSYCRLSDLQPQLGQSLQSECSAFGSLQNAAPVLYANQAIVFYRSVLYVVHPWSHIEGLFSLQKVPQAPLVPCKSAMRLSL